MFWIIWDVYVMGILNDRVFVLCCILEYIYFLLKIKYLRVNGINDKKKVCFCKCFYEVDYMLELVGGREFYLNFRGDLYVFKK